MEALDSKGRGYPFSFLVFFLVFFLCVSLLVAGGGTSFFFHLTLRVWHGFGEGEFRGVYYFMSGEYNVCLYIHTRYYI